MMKHNTGSNLKKMVTKKETPNPQNNMKVDQTSTSKNQILQ